MKKHPLKLLIILLIILLYSSPVYANDVVVVLDPGHGGDSLGGHNDMFQEMYLNMEVAKYAKERLEQYEGVVVYLTRDNAESENTTLKERAEFAAAHLQMSRMSGAGHGDKACLFRVQFLIRHDGDAQSGMQAGRHRIRDESCPVAGRIRHDDIYRVFHTSTPV